MAVVNVEHLLDQARELIQPPPAGPPRQANLRRAISGCYYAVFHHVLTKAAGEFVGVTKRGDLRYALVYRSVDHKTLRELCVEAGKRTLPLKLRTFLPGGGFGGDIAAFAKALVELQERRHAADYDPSLRLKTSDAKSAIQLAETGVRRFDAGDPDLRQMFPTLLLFSAR